MLFVNVMRNTNNNKQFTILCINVYVNIPTCGLHLNLDGWIDKIYFTHTYIKVHMSL